MLLLYSTVQIIVRSNHLSEYRVVSVIPATAVGKANGKSINPSNNRFPGNE